jgi:hypothetical protein
VSGEYLQSAELSIAAKTLILRQNPQYCMFVQSTRAVSKAFTAPSVSRTDELRPRFAASLVRATRQSTRAGPPIHPTADECRQAGSNIFDLTASVASRSKTAMLVSAEKYQLVLSMFEDPKKTIRPSTAMNFA